MINSFITDRQLSANEIIRVLRNEKGLTLRTLAERSGVSESCISRWESGDRVPNIDAYIRTIEALGAEVVIIRKREKNNNA